MNNTLRRALIGTGSTAFTLVGAGAIGLGVPLFWIWVASQFYDKPGAVTGSVAIFIGTGILVSYWAILLVASWIRARLQIAAQGPPGIRRQSWNRSMRDEPFKPGQGSSDPIERLFVATAIISIIGFMIWFAFFAGSSIPNA